MAKTDTQRVLFLQEIVNFLKNSLTKKQFDDKLLEFGKNYKKYGFSVKFESFIEESIARKTNEEFMVSDKEILDEFSKKIKELESKNDSFSVEEDFSTRPETTETSDSPARSIDTLVKSRLSMQSSNIKKRLGELGGGSATENERVELKKTLKKIEDFVQKMEEGVEISPEALRKITTRASQGLQRTQGTTLTKMEGQEGGVESRASREAREIVELYSRSLNAEQKELFRKTMRLISFTTVEDFQEKAKEVSSQIPQRVEIISKTSLGMESSKKDVFRELVEILPSSLGSLEEFSQNISILHDKFLDIGEDVEKIFSELTPEERRKMLESVGESVSSSSRELISKFEEISRELKEDRKFDEKFFQLSDEEKTMVREYVGDTASLTSEEIRERFLDAIDDLELDKDKERGRFVDRLEGDLNKKQSMKFRVESVKLEKKLKAGEISQEEFSSRLRKMREGMDPEIFGGLASGLLGMTKAVSGSTKALENMKESSNMFVQEFGETFERLKAQRKDHLKGMVGAATTKIFTGNMVSKTLFMIPGLGPLLAGGFGLISMATGGVLKLAKSIFGAITSTFKVVGQVLSTMTRVAKGVLGRTIKWGLGGLAILTLLYKTGLLEKIPKIIATLWKTVYPILMKIVQTALQYANETLEYLIDLVRRGIETGLIREFPKMILSFIRGIFTSKEASAIGAEFSRFGSNLAELGTLVLEAITELWTGLKEVWMDELWPNYIKPAFEYLKKNIPIWFNQLWDSLTKWYETSDIGKWIQENVVEPLSDAFDKLAWAAKWAAIALGLIGGFKVGRAGVRAGMSVGRGVRRIKKWRRARAMRGAATTAKAKVATGGMVRDAKGRFVKKAAAPVAKVGILGKLGSALKVGLLGAGKLLAKGLAGGLAIATAPIVLTATAIAGLAVGWKLWQMKQEDMQHERMMKEAERMREAAGERNKREGAIQSELRSILGSNMKTNELLGEQEEVERRLDELNESIRVGHGYDAEGNRLSREQLIELRDAANARKEALRNVVSTRQFTKQELESSEEGRNLISRLSPERLEELERTGRVSAQDYEEQSIGLRSSMEGRRGEASRAREITQILRQVQAARSPDAQRAADQKLNDLLEGMSPEERLRFGLDEGNMGGKSLVGMQTRYSPGAYGGPGSSYSVRGVSREMPRILASIEQFAERQERTLGTSEVELAVSEALEAGQKYIEAQRKLDDARVREASEESRGEVSEETREEISRLTSEVETARRTAMDLQKSGADRARAAAETDGEDSLMNQQAIAVGFFENFEPYIENLRQGSGIGGIRGTRERMEQMNVLGEMEKRIKILGDDPEAERLREAINDLRDKILEGTITQEEANDELSELGRNLNRNSTLLRAERAAKKKEEEERKAKEFEEKGGFMGALLDAVGASLGDEYKEATESLKRELGIGVQGMSNAAEGNVGASAAAEVPPTAEPPDPLDDPNNYTESGAFDPDLAAQERRWRAEDEAGSTEAVSRVAATPNRWRRAAQELGSVNGVAPAAPMPAASSQAAQAAETSAAGLAAGAIGTPGASASATPSPLEGGSGGAGAVGMDPSEEAATPVTPAAPMPAASSQAAQAAETSAAGLAAGATGTPGASAGAGQAAGRQYYDIKYNEDGSIIIDITSKSASSIGPAIDTARNRVHSLRRLFKDRLIGAVNIREMEESKMNQTKESDGKVLFEQTLTIPADAIIDAEGARERLGSIGQRTSSPPSAPASSQAAAPTPSSGSGLAEQIAHERAEMQRIAAQMPAASSQAAQAAETSAAGLAAGATGTPGASASASRTTGFSIGGEFVSPDAPLNESQIRLMDMAISMSPNNASNYPSWVLDDYAKQKGIDRDSLPKGSDFVPTTTSETTTPPAAEAPLAAASNAVQGELAEQAGDVVSSASDVAADIFMGRTDRLGITTEEDPESESSRSRRLMKALEAVEGEEAKELVTALQDLIIAFKKGEITQQEASDRLSELTGEMRENSEIMGILTEQGVEEVDEEEANRRLAEALGNYESPGMLDTNDVFAKSNLGSWFASDKTTPPLPVASAEVSESAGASASGMSDASVGTAGAGGIAAPSGGVGVPPKPKYDPNETMQFLVWPGRITMGEIKRLQKSPNNIKHALMNAYMGENGLSNVNQASLNEAAKWTDENLAAATEEIMNFDVERWHQLQEYARQRDTDPSYNQATGVSMSDGDSSSATPALASASSGATASAIQSTESMASVSVGESPKRLSDDELEKFLIEGGNFQNFEEKFGRPITNDDKRRLRHIDNAKSGRVINQAHSQVVDMDGKETTVGELTKEQSREDEEMGFVSARGTLNSRNIHMQRLREGARGEVDYSSNDKHNAIDTMIRMKLKMMEMSGEFIRPEDAMDAADAERPIRERLKKDYEKMSLQQLVEEVDKIQKEYLDATKARREMINSVFDAAGKADDESRLAGIEQRRAEEEAEIAAEEQSAADIPAASEQISETVSSSVEGMTAGATGTPGESASRDRVPNMDDLAKFAESASDIDIQKSNVRLAEQNLNRAKTRTRPGPERDREVKRAEERLAAENQKLADMESGTYVPPASTGPVIGPDDENPPNPSGPQIVPPPTTASMENASEMNQSAAEIEDARVASGGVTTIINNNSVASSNNQNNTSMIAPSYSSRPAAAAPSIGIYSVA